jgi:hypothetical protein
MTRRALLVAALLVGALIMGPKVADALPFKAVRARLLILELDLAGAEEILSGEDADPEVAIERARLALYRGDCDAALAIIERPDLEEVESHPLLLEVSKGCARGTAATVIVRDDVKGVVVRFQDDEDRALFPIIADTAVAAREMLHKELGTRLPDPVWIDLVRDQFTLAAMTGLPERAAKTTGTVAVAKWGRVIMISPRAASAGYPWLDTLTHELTHLVLSQATRERAPLWLQEGVAKRQEIRWRPATPFDGIPSADAVAWHGILKGIALPLDGLGPSIAMLPSPEQATVAFAEVSSFIQYWVAQNGETALPKLLTAIRDQLPSADVSDAIKEVSGKTLGDWDIAWRNHLANLSPVLRSDFAPGGGGHSADASDRAQAARRRRLGELLLMRRHHHGASHELSAAHALVPSDASVRCMFVDALRGVGEEVQAASLVVSHEDVLLPTGRWWSLHELFAMGDALPHSRLYAIGHHPTLPPIPCHELPEGDLPADPVHRAICEAAWRVPRE